LPGLWDLFFHINSFLFLQALPWLPGTITPYDLPAFRFLLSINPCCRLHRASSSSCVLCFLSYFPIFLARFLPSLLHHHSNCPSMKLFALKCSTMCTPLFALLLPSIHQHLLLEAGQFIHSKANKEQHSC